MSSKPIPDNMLRHLQYLRNLHLESPRIGNIYLQDSALREYTNHLIGNNLSFQKQLQRLGDRFANQYIKASRNAEENHPRLEQFDSYGRRIDKLHLSEGWKTIAKMSAQDGIVAMAYEEDKHNLKQLQRYGQLVALYLYQPSSGLFGCPLAMTDGAAYTLIGLLNTEGIKRGIINQAFNHLTSRTQPWTSGQWMTEKKGGSDVSNTETLAIKEPGQNFYRLYGYKWFTSATDSDMSLALAKILPSGVEPTLQVLKNIKVSLFLIKMRVQEGKLNNMEIVRLKDKLGTRQLPTAELLLKGSEGHLISGEEQGVKYISKMLAVTRLYNSSTAVAVIRRTLALARDYSQRRTIGKTKLSQLPLQIRVLSHMEVTHRANLIFFLKISELFSKQHSKTINNDEANLLRVMSPLLKLFTAKQALEVCTEGLEAFGGMGYIEGSMLPSLLRDSQVLSIWQGTTNVLCYDFVRALMKKENSVQPIQSLIKFSVEAFQRIAARDVRDQKFIHCNQLLVLSYNNWMKDLTSAIENKFQSFGQDKKENKSKVNPMAELRNLCFGTARIFTALLLQNHILLTVRANDIQVSSRWIERGLYRRENYDTEKDRVLALDIDHQGRQRGGGDIDQRGVLRGRL